jgi:hypothetical protein
MIVSPTMITTSVAFTSLAGCCIVMEKSISTRFIVLCLEKFIATVYFLDVFWLFWCLRDGGLDSW